MRRVLYRKFARYKHSLFMITIMSAASPFPTDDVPSRKHSRGHELIDPDCTIKLNYLVSSQNDPIFRLNSCKRL